MAVNANFALLAGTSMMITVFLLVLFIVVGKDYTAPQQSPRAEQFGKTKLIMTELISLGNKHEAAFALLELVEQDGAGRWPPAASFEAWPGCVNVYKEIYEEVFQSLTCQETSMNDEVNSLRRSEFRLLMRNLLCYKVHLAEVEDIMKSVELGNWGSLSRSQFNGLYCVVAYLRHAYRWAINPVVRVAQAESVINFPDELETPWRYLQRIFGCTADSGNHTSNVLLPFDIVGKQIIRTNLRATPEIMNTENNFFLLFHNWETKAFPIYVEVVRAIIAFGDQDTTECVNSLRRITAFTRQLFAVFYSNLRESLIYKEPWLRYTQGFHSWAAGKFVNDEFVKYEGMSGSHVLALQVLDGFLDIQPYLSDVDLMHYVPARQREFSALVRRHSFRYHVNKDTEGVILEELDKLVYQLKNFRLGHKRRVMPYLKQQAPERRHMTAGKSIKGDVSIEVALRPLEDILTRRIKATR